MRLRITRGWAVLRAFVVGHLFFWRPILQPEFDPAAEEHRRMHEEISAGKRALRSLGSDALTHVTAQLKDVVDMVRRDIAETRARAAQLLAAVGFTTVLAGIGGSLPSRAIPRTLTYVAVALAFYTVTGTLWLTFRALAVRHWEDLTIQPAAQATSEKVRQDYACQLFHLQRTLTCRHSVPVGYLRDAYGFFFASVLLIFVIIILRFVP